MKQINFAITNVCITGIRNLKKKKIIKKNKNKNKTITEINSSKSLHTAITGGVATALSTLVTHPLDTLRVRIAAQYIDIHYKTTFNAIKSISKTENLTAFYRGLPTTIVGTGVRGAVGFSLYETNKSQKLKNWETKHPYIARLIIGVGSGLIAVIASYPFDTIRRFPTKNQLFFPVFFFCLCDIVVPFVMFFFLRKSAIVSPPAPFVHIVCLLVCLFCKQTLKESALHNLFFCSVFL